MRHASESASAVRQRRENAETSESRAVRESAAGGHEKRPKRTKRERERTEERRGEERRETNRPIQLDLIEETKPTRTKERQRYKNGDGRQQQD
jgi:hypothetical protein